MTSKRTRKEWSKTEITVGQKNLISRLKPDFIGVEKLNKLEASELISAMLYRKQNKKGA